MLEDRQHNALAALDILARADSTAFAAGRADGPDRREAVAQKYERQALAATGSQKTRMEAAAAKVRAQMQGRNDGLSSDQAKWTEAYDKAKRANEAKSSKPGAKPASGRNDAGSEPRRVIFHVELRDVKGNMHDIEVPAYGADKQTVGSIAKKYLQSKGITAEVVRVNETGRRADGARNDAADPKLWEQFREKFGPRPGGRGAQERWEKQWERFQAENSGNAKRNDSAFSVGQKVSYAMGKGKRGKATIKLASSTKKNHYYIVTETEGTILVPADELSADAGRSDASPSRTFAFGGKWKVTFVDFKTKKEQTVEWDGPSADAVELAVRRKYGISWGDIVSVKQVNGRSDADQTRSDGPIKTNTPKEVAPPGKRSIRENTWGNTNAYIAGRFWKTIGPTYAVGTEERAAAFLRGEDD